MMVERNNVDRRREETAVMQESAHRMSEITVSGLEVMQKQIAFASTLTRFWSDSLNSVEQSMNSLISMHRR